MLIIALNQSLNEPLTRCTSDITVRDISFRTELTLFPIDVGRELPALDLSFHLHPSVDAPLMWPSN
jgi:hypothetical protein